MLDRSRQIHLDNESDYNFDSDEETDNGNSDFLNSSTNQIKGVFDEDSFSYDQYKLSAEMWNITQLNEELTSMGKEASELGKLIELENKEKKMNPSTPLSKKNDYRKTRKKNKRNEYCFCKGKYSLSSPMVQCDSCDAWYHQLCVNLSQHMCDRMSSYICSDCKEEQLEELDRKNNFIGQNKINARKKIINFEFLKNLIESNESYYFSSKKNFLSLFEGNEFCFQFCNDSLELSEEKIRAKIFSIERKIRKMNREHNGKSTKKRSSSVKREKRREDDLREYESDTPIYIRKENQKRFRDTKMIFGRKLDPIAMNENSEKPKKVNEKERDPKLVRKIKRLMDSFKFSQKALAKKMKLTGGSTSLSAWLNGNRVYNLHDKQRQIRKWYKEFVSDKISVKYAKHKTPSMNKKTKRKGFKVGEKVDFLAKGEWIEAKILKATKGQYFIQFVTDKGKKKKWIASMAKRLAKLNSQRKNATPVMKKGKKVIKTVVNSEKPE